MESPGHLAGNFGLSWVEGQAMWVSQEGQAGLTAFIMKPLHSQSINLHSWGQSLLKLLILTPVVAHFQHEYQRAMKMREGINMVSSACIYNLQPRGK